MNQNGRVPPLSVLRAFEATVRHESVSRAARELHLTDGAVSRAVRELEAELGFSLFERGNRVIRPQPAARALAAEIRAGLEALGAAMSRARRMRREDRPLVLSCEPTLLIRWLIPRLAALQEAVGLTHDIRFVSAGGPVAFARDGIDLAIRRADFTLADDVVAEPFLDERIGPVCRPDLAGILAGHGPIRGALLHTATRRGAWERWSTLTGVQTEATRTVVFEHFYQSLQGAIAGAGLAIGPIALVADDLRNGSLCAPYGFVADGTRYVLMRQKDSDGDGLFAAVLGWLKTQANDLQAMGMAATHE